MSIMVWGHRGHRRHRAVAGATYENSLKAYAETLKTSVGVECDVVQSKQGTAYLVHDTLFDGFVNYALKNHLDEPSATVLGNRFIFQLNDAEIDQLRLKDGQPIPRLSQLLELMKDYPGRTLTIELKGPGVWRTAVKTVENAIQKKYVTADQIIFGSYNFPALRELRYSVEGRFRLVPSFAMTQLQMTPMFPNWPNASQDAWYIPFDAKGGIFQRADLRDIRPDFVGMDAASLTWDAIQAMEDHMPHVKLIVGMLGEPDPEKNPAMIELIRDFVTSGKLYAIICDLPDIVQRKLIDNGIDVRLP
jgi:glycerophosphoryl diester phosphodiesterase